MPMQEKSVFIQDPRPNMTTEEKNLHLSAKLAAGPHVKRLIVTIERLEIGASGWRITYRVGGTG